MNRLFIRNLIVVVCWIISARMVRAQETINYASVSGRVIDPQGAVVPGAQVSARQTDTNVTADTVTDSEGRFRFPYLRIGPYEVGVHVQVFRDSTRALRLSVGSAFDIPIVLAVAGLNTSVTVTDEATILEAAYPAVGAVDEGYLVAWTSGPAAQSVIRVERMTRHK